MTGDSRTAKYRAINRAGYTFRVECLQTRSSGLVKGSNPRTRSCNIGRRFIKTMHDSSEQPVSTDTRPGWTRAPDLRICCYRPACRSVPVPAFARRCRCRCQTVAAADDVTSRSLLLQLFLSLTPPRFVLVLLFLLIDIVTLSPLPPPPPPSSRCDIVLFQDPIRPAINSVDRDRHVACCCTEQVLS
jgi:hypothetical protein